MADELSSLARALGKGIGRVKHEIDRKIGKTNRPVVVSYRGYANERTAYLIVRVMLDPGLSKAHRNDLWWRNLLNTYKRAESDELAGALVRFDGFGSVLELRSDEEGFIHAQLPILQRGEALWQEVQVDLLSPSAPSGDRFSGRAQVILPPADAQYGVISDLDDTVIRTDVTSIVRMVRATAFSNAHTRLPFHGVTAFYQALHRGTHGRPTNPIFYVSSSPWNLYDLLEEFMAVRGIPMGPMFLRDWGLSVNPSANAPHKLEAITRIMEAFPQLPFILIGDSGQEDPDIYRKVMQRYPGRVRAAYIRNVTPHPEKSARLKALIDEVTASGATMVLTDDTLAAAQHALAQGWIDTDAINAIARDEALEDKKEPAPEEEAGPTVVVNPDGTANP